MQKHCPGRQSRVGVKGKEILLQQTLAITIPDDSSVTGMMCGVLELRPLTLA